MSELPKMKEEVNRLSPQVIEVRGRKKYMEEEEV
jgi:hypothetical protein